MGDIRAVVEHELVRFAYRNAMPAPFINSSVALITAFVMLTPHNTGLVWGWLLLSLLLSSARLFTLLAFRRREPSRDSSARWRRGYEWISVGTGLAWGGGAVVLLPGADVKFQLFYSVVIGGMVAGAIPVLSALRRAYLWFLAGCLLPLLVVLMYEGQPLHWGAAMIGLLFFGFMLRGMFAYHATLAESFTVQAEKSELVGRLQEERRRAEAASASKSEFLANMSHELRTPISGIMGMADLLTQDDLSPQLWDKIDTIRRSSHNLLSIINDILDFSKVESGHLELEEIPFSIHAVIGDCLRLLEIEAQAKNLFLQSWIAPDVPEMLLGDPGRFRQVLFNLLGNALKFTDNGHVRIEVSVLPAESADIVPLRVLVQDCGVGILPDHVERVFQPFVQADNSITRRYGGTGLGLAICNRLIERFGGRLYVCSEPLKGSQFGFRANFGRLSGPLLLGDAPKPQVEAMPLAIGIIVGSRTVSPRRPGVEWVVWPDEASMLADIQSGRQVDLVMIDVEREAGDGFVLAQHWIGWHANIPMVLISPESNGLDASLAKACGADAYLHGPLSADDLGSLLSRLCGKVWTSQQVELKPPGIAPSAEQCAVLLVEDAPINQKVISAMLERLGHVVTLAHDGADALAQATLQRFDVILMDVQMPVMDGLTATRQLREYEIRSGLARTPIIALTANVMGRAKEECLAAGMDDYLPKPLDFERLRAVLEQWAKPGALIETPAVSSAPDDGVLDLEGALQLMGGDRSLYDLVADAFASDYLRYLAGVEEAFAAEDWERARREAHTLKGVLATLGASTAAQSAKSLEHICRDARKELVAGALAQLRSDCGLVHSALACLVPQNANQEG